MPKRITKAFRAKVVAEAREWTGTPFVPQQSVKGRGCDCKGLIAGVARGVGRPEGEHVHALATDYQLGKGVPSARLKAGLLELFDDAGKVDPLPGDVLLLKHDRAPGHLAIVTEAGLKDGRAVHAQVDPLMVVETRLRALLRVYELDTVLRWRGI